MKAKILLVDDEASIRHSLGEILHLEGYDVVPAESGEAALEAIQSSPFDLVLLDLKMPGMDGLDVLRHIHKHAPDTKVILLTAHGSLESAVEALRQGAHDYILKPANSRSILNSVESALVRRAEIQHKRLLIDQLEASIQRLRDVEGGENKAIVEQQTVALSNGVLLDMMKREIWRGNQKVNLTPTEGRLMKVLIENRGRVLSHQELVFLVQGYDSSELDAPEILRPIISRLRRKLAILPGGAKWIVNVRSTGYVFEIEGE
jgi:DNA-binding response OmpR family regulator